MKVRCARPTAWSRVRRVLLRNWAYLDRRSNQRLENSESTGIISRRRSFCVSLPEFRIPSNLTNFVNGPNGLDFTRRSHRMLKFQHHGLKLRLTHKLRH